MINHFYETMREVAPGEVIYSFADGKLQGFGIARTTCYTSPRPADFGHIGAAWNEIGWRVDVEFHRFTLPLDPKDHMKAIEPTLPSRYSPIRANGYGNQGAYLAEIPESMALIVAQLASPELLAIIQGISMADADNMPLPEPQGIREWEELECETILASQNLAETEKQTLIKARRGQGIFRFNVAQIERRCRVTKVEKPEHLVASHIKPWRESNNHERLFQGNGLLLTPTIDHLFDRGFISFEDTGELLISPVAHKESLHKMGVDTNHVIRVGSFAEVQKEFLEFHRSSIFLKTAR